MRRQSITIAKARISFLAALMLVLTGCVNAQNPVDSTKVDSTATSQTEALKASTPEVAQDSSKVMPETATSKPSTQQVTLDGSKGKLKAVVHKPSTTGKITTPFVVIMHGFTGNKNEKMLIQISEGLQSRGIGSIRFDFNAHGESEGKFEEMTIANEIEDAAKVLDYVKHLSWVDSTRIGVLGHSQGGVVASMTAGIQKYPSIKAAVLLAPAANIGEGAKKGNLLGRNFDPNHIPEVIDVWNHKVGRKYLQVAAAMPMYETAAEFTGPALVIHGSKDTAVPCEFGKRYADGYKNCKWVLQPDDDHGLSRHRSQTLGLIYSFFEKNL